ncbi:MAG TPA: phosphoglycerate dehydrogenase [Burkholderiales bacterium]|jgi:D-3-phosphoglycerate dehydrogenase|nr:phosphoglycerate dehydrogenase [Burkholderiales bacterium]
MAEKLRILTLNNISHAGLKRLPPDRYAVGAQIDNPDAVLVRSQDMHSMPIPPSVKAIGRAGVGVNNIPVKAMNSRGIPVFNAPGANANAVKELVLAGMLMAARNIPAALKFVEGLSGSDERINLRIEEEKRHFAGIELPHHTLGVIGLGRIGSLVADAAIKLGMNVHGYDPDITVDAAWSLPSQVRKAHSVEEIVRGSEFVTLHVPLLESTRNLINERRLALMKHGAVLLNFSREGIVDNVAVVEALAAKRLRYYVCDFPAAGLVGHPGVIALPHVGASTREAEDNCAVMVVDQMRDYLEHGNIRNAVNFPDVLMARESPYRLGIANANVPNMVGQISTTVARAGLNIHNMINKSKQDMAYTLVDVDSPVPAKVIEELAAIDGVLAVRYLPADQA